MYRNKATDWKHSYCECNCVIAPIMLFTCCLSLAHLLNVSNIAPIRYPRQISRPKTASDRQTSSQQQSYQRMLKSIKKKQAALQNEKAKIRNWSIKG